MTLSMQITSAHDAALVQAGRTLIESLGDAPATEQPVTDPAPSRDIISAVAIATLVLTIPGALLATAQLVDRLKSTTKRQEIKDRITPIVALLDQTDSSKSSVFLMAWGHPIDFRTKTIDEILDKLHDAAVDAQDKKE